MADFIHNVPIKVPNKSGFDLSHEKIFTGVCGELAPVLVHELLPNDTISLGASFQVQLPPAVSDFYGRVSFHLEAFFVPNRICWAGWKDFITHPTSAPQYPVGTLASARPDRLPSAAVYFGFPVSSANDDSISNAVSAFNRAFGPGSLCDYLGYHLNSLQDSDFDSLHVSDFLTDEQFNFIPFEFKNLLPFVAYHRIWDDWYRDSRIQAPCFVPPPSRENGDFFSALPWQSGKVFSINGNTVARWGASIILPSTSASEAIPLETDRLYCGDGQPFSNIRLRNWSKDYFTTASPYPQASIVGGKVDLPVVDGETSLSISALRSANALQMWLERNNLAGYRYADQIYAQFGRYPADAIMDRPIYLGRIKQAIYTKSVYQQSNSEGVVTSNPFKTVGAKYGSLQAISDGSLIDSFTSSEHGFLIVLASLVPHAYYSGGVSRYLQRSKVGDFAFPLLSGMGDQAIRKSELSSDLSVYLNDSDFGYTDLYAEYKVENDFIMGYLRDGQNLESFSLQRSFDSSPELGSDFLQIPRTYLDQVLTVDVMNTRFSYWADVYWTFKKSSTLPVYSQPTLMDLQNSHIETISRGGSRL